MGLADDLQYLEYYSEGLTAFKEMIIGLNESKVIVLDSEDPHYHRLPKVGKSRLHYTHKDQPRTLLEFRFKYQGRALSIFEIDLDDHVKSISTLIIQWNSNTQPSQEVIKKLTRMIVKRSLRWPTKETLSEWGSFKTIHHPKKSQESMQYTSDEIELWRQNIIRHLSTLGHSPLN